MARIRTIKPEIFQDAKTAKLPARTFRLLIGLICNADDYGNQHGEPGMLRGLIFWGQPKEGNDVEGQLDDLDRAGLITRYAVAGQNYIHLRGWTKHQKVAHPGKPMVPGPSDVDAAELKRVSRGSHEDLMPDLDPDLDQDLDPDLDHDREVGQAADVARPDPIRAVFEHYRTHHAKAHPRPSPKSQEWQKIKARMAEGYSVEDLKTAIDGYHRSPWHCGENDRHRTYLALELIMRDGSKVAQGIEFAKQPPGPRLSEREARGARASLNWLERQQRKGAP